MPTLQQAVKALQNNQDNNLALRNTANNLDNNNNLALRNIANNNLAQNNIIAVKNIDNHENASDEDSESDDDQTKSSNLSNISKSIESLASIKNKEFCAFKISKGKNNKISTICTFNHNRTDMDQDDIECHRTKDNKCTKKRFCLEPSNRVFSNKPKKISSKNSKKSEPRDRCKFYQNQNLQEGDVPIKKHDPTCSIKVKGDVNKNVSLVRYPDGSISYRPEDRKYVRCYNNEIRQFDRQSKVSSKFCLYKKRPKASNQKKEGTDDNFGHCTKYHTEKLTGHSKECYVNELNRCKLKIDFNKTSKKLQKKNNNDSSSSSDIPKENHEDMFEKIVHFEYNIIIHILKKPDIIETKYSNKKEHFPVYYYLPCCDTFSQVFLHDFTKDLKYTIYFDKNNKQHYFIDENIIHYLNRIILINYYPFIKSSYHENLFLPISFFNEQFFPIFFEKKVGSEIDYYEFIAGKFEKSSLENLLSYNEKLKNDAKNNFEDNEDSNFIELIDQTLET